LGEKKWEKKKEKSFPSIQKRKKAFGIDSIGSTWRERAARKEKTIP